MEQDKRERGGKKVLDGMEQEQDGKKVLGGMAQGQVRMVQGDKKVLGGMGQEEWVRMVQEWEVHMEQGW